MIRPLICIYLSEYGIHHIGYEVGLRFRFSPYKNRRNGNLTLIPVERSFCLHGNSIVSSSLKRSIPRCYIHQYRSHFQTTRNLKSRRNCGYTYGGTVIPKSRRIECIQVINAKCQLHLWLVGMSTMHNKAPQHAATSRNVKHLGAKAVSAWCLLSLCLANLYFGNRRLVWTSATSHDAADYTDQLTKLESPSVVREERAVAGKLEYTTIAKKLLRTLSKSGKKYACPCCGWIGDSFDSMVKRNAKNARPMENRRCPVCRSLERHRRVCAILGSGKPRWDNQQQWLQPPHPKTNIPFRLVHFGPEPSMERTINKATGVDQVSLDYINADYRYSKHVMHADVTNIPLPDKFANGIMIFHVLEHIPDVSKALLELKRIMKGWIMLEVPCKDLGQHKDCRGNMTRQERHECAGQWDHVWRYDCTQFSQDLHEAGLDCYSIEKRDFGDFMSLEPNCNCHSGTNYNLGPLYICRSDGKGAIPDQRRRSSIDLNNIIN